MRGGGAAPAATGSAVATPAPPTTTIAARSGTSSRMRSTFSQMSLPGIGPSATSTRVPAARRISTSWYGSSSGLTGLEIPAASAPYSV